MKSEYKTTERIRKNSARQRAKRKADPVVASADREYQRQYRALNKDRLRETSREYQRDNAIRHRLHRKGIKDPALEALVAGTVACQICGGPPDGRWKTFQVDHCHETGGFRGVICASCNVGLARFKDDPTILRAAAHYLDQSRKMVPHEAVDG